MPRPKGRKPTKAPEEKPVKAPEGPDRLNRWAHVGIGLSIGMSAGLNGFANAQHAQYPVAGWALGILVPALVVVLARVSGGAFARGWRQLALAGALVCVSLLGLSVSHCARAFAALTGADYLSAVMMAVGIDCGLVVCELMTITKKGR